MGKILRAILLWCFVLLAVGDAEAYQNPGVLSEIQDVANALEKGKGVAKKVAAIRKKRFLGDVMNAYKPRRKGGIGIGPPSKNDGIEAKIIKLGRRTLSNEGLAKERRELEKLAFLNLALGKIVRAYAPALPKAGIKWNAKDWNTDADQQEKASMDLLDAIRRNDAAGIKKSAQSLNAACNNCHR